MRVQPHIKKASERILQRMGLNMSEAMEMFLHRVIVDEAIPFTVVSVREAQYAALEKAMYERDQKPTTSANHRKEGRQ
jgi:addiction module RelB/DinJ family antitoxin